MVFGNQQDYHLTLDNSLDSEILNEVEMIFTGSSTLSTTEQVN